MPLLDFSFSFRNGEVGGDKGFDAALAFRNSEAAASAPEGDSRNTSMTIHNAIPTIIVIGFVRRNDRAGPMAPVFSWRPQSMKFRNFRAAFAFDCRAGMPFRGGAENRSRPQKNANSATWIAEVSPVVNNNLLERVELIAWKLSNGFLR